MFADASGELFPTDSQWGRPVKFVGGAVKQQHRGATGPKRCGTVGEATAIGQLSELQTLFRIEAGDQN
jgi:hypothetical protein